MQRKNKIKKTQPLRIEKSGPNFMIQQVSQEEIINFDDGDIINIPSKSKDSIIQQIHQVNPLSKNVPIYRIQSKIHRIYANYQTQYKNTFFAHGQLIGKFYQSLNVFNIKDVSIIGIFEGMFDWNNKGQNYEQFYFEGVIRKIQLLTDQQQPFDDKTLNEVSCYESTFHGYFQGYFYPWSLVGGVQNINKDGLTFKDPGKTPLSFHYLSNMNCNNIAHNNIIQINKKIQYFLPTLCCLQIKNIGDINLQKSSAIINGFLYVKFKYNSLFQQIIEQQKKKKQQIFIGLNFNRERTLFLPIIQQEIQQSQSQWSLNNRAQDIQFHIDKQNKTYIYKVYKRFHCQIDNTHGSFFAPFNLNRLRIVISFASLKFRFQEQTIKWHFTCVDTFDYGYTNIYNPFEPFNNLSSNLLSQSQINRYYKINRHFCNDSGEYIIADNRLTLYPHYKNILRNKHYINEDVLWNLGMRNELHYLEPQLAENTREMFHKLVQLNKEKSISLDEQKFPVFSLLLWDKVIIQAPIYKYIVIDMLKIFLPLTLITILSLLMYDQQNGIGKDSSFTTLAYRLVNVAAIAIAYTTLIPVIIQSLPIMPGITLLEIMTYIQTIPSLLVVVNSIIYYHVRLEDWQKTFRTFGDGLFLLSLLISLINISALFVVFFFYSKTQYTSKCRPKRPNDTVRDWRSPMYIKFIQSVIKYKSDYYNIIQQNT